MSPSTRTNRLAAAVAAALAVALVPAGTAGAAPAPGRPVPAAAAAAADPFASTAADGRVAARRALADTKASSVSLALVDRGRVVWRETFGAVDAAGTKPGYGTMYGIGSVSKMFAAVAVMQLVDAGRVSLDAPLTRYLPDFRMADPAYRQITVRMLLDHSAGLPGTSAGNGVTSAPYAGYADGVLAGLRTQRLKTAPGSMSVYCNDCFTLAGLVVERVGGKPFPDYVRDAVLAPLGMARTTYTTRPLPGGSYAPALAGGAPLAQNYVNIYASAGTMSTPTDMSALATMFADGGVYRGRRVLSAAAVAQMGTDQTRTTLDPTAVDPTAVQPYRYGLGWDTVAEPGLAAVGVRAWVKGGDVGRYHAGFVVAPDAGLSMTVTGVGGDFSSTAAEDIAQRVLLHALVARGTVKALPAVLGAPALARRSPTPAVLRSITGVYTAYEYTFRVAARSDGSIAVSTLTGGRWTAGTVHTLRADGAFWSPGSPGTSLRAVRAWGRTYLVRRAAAGYGHYRQDIVVGQRTAPGEPLSAAWRARVGRTWVLVDEMATSDLWEAPGSTLSQIPDLPGYLLVEGSDTSPVDAGGSDTFAPMFVVVPTMLGRDLADLAVVARDGQEWLRLGPTPLRPLDGVADLAAGAQAVAVGADGYAQWRRVPAAGRVAVGGATAWKAYDAGLAPTASGDGGTDGADVPAGGYLVVFAAPGATAQVAFAPAA